MQETNNYINRRTHRTCEWCDHRAHMKAQIMKKKNKRFIGTAMYWYACSDHASKLDNIEYLSDKELINYESYTTRSS